MFRQTEILLLLPRLQLRRVVSALVQRKKSLRARKKLLHPRRLEARRLSKPNSLKKKPSTLPKRPEVRKLSKPRFLTMSLSSLQRRPEARRLSRLKSPMRSSMSLQRRLQARRLSKPRSPTRNLLSLQRRSTPEAKRQLRLNQCPRIRKQPRARPQ